LLNPSKSPKCSSPSLIPSKSFKSRFKIPIESLQLHQHLILAEQPISKSSLLPKPSFHKKISKSQVTLVFNEQIKQKVEAVEVEVDMAIKQGHCEGIHAAIQQLSKVFDSLL
jgi:uncharacterized protein YgbK (DUF1537 family)